MSDALHVLHSLASRIGPPVEAAARYLLGYALVGRFDSFCVQVKDRSWHVIRERGALVEEAGDEDGGEREGDGEVVDEKAALAGAGDVDEHVELGEVGYTEPQTADVHV